MRRHCGRHQKSTATRAIACVLVATQVMLSCGSARPTPPEPIPPGQRTLQAGDIIRIDVWRQPEYSGEFHVGADGTLLHPLYQEIPAAGLSTTQVREQIANLLTGYLQGARLVVEPLFSVAIGGEVREPDVYHVRGGTTIAQIVGMAGGPTTRAELNRILLVRAAEEYELNLGDDVSTFGSIPVVSGDQILVYPRSDFSLWRDIVGPVATLTSLVLAVLRIGDRT